MTRAVLVAGMADLSSTELEFIVDTQRGTLIETPHAPAARLPISTTFGRRSRPPRMVGQPAGYGPLPVPPQSTARRWSWEVLVYPSFRWYFAGSVVSNLGTWLQNAAQALLAYRLTHSVLAVGVVAAAQFSSVLLLGPWAGVVAGRARDLRTQLIATQVISAAAAAALAALQFAGALTEAWLVAGAFGLGLAYCFALPATSVLVPSFVPEQATPDETRREIRAAMVLDSASYNIGRAVAPVLAVLVVINIGFGWAFAINAASFLVLAAALDRARPCSGQHQRSPAKIMDGFHAIKRDQRIPLLLIIVAAVTVSADPVLVLGPALAHHFGAPGAWAGYFLSALGLGTVVGSFVPLRPPSRVRHAAYPLFLLGAAVVVFALGLDRWVSLAAALVAGIACLLTGAVARALLFAFHPQDRSAVMGVWAWAWAGSKPLASLADGLLATIVVGWAAGLLPWAWAAHLPGIQTAGVLLALPALVPAMAVMVFGRSRPSGKPESPEAVVPV
jgi:hypothetical protein